MANITIVPQSVSPVGSARIDTVMAIGNTYLISNRTGRIKLVFSTATTGVVNIATPLIVDGLLLTDQSVSITANPVYVGGLTPSTFNDINGNTNVTLTSGAANISAFVD